MKSGLPAASNKGPIVSKVILLGDSGVGKTSVINSFMFKDYKHVTMPTIGADFHNAKVKLTDNFDDQINLQIWDTAGQEQFQSLCRAFYRGSDCVVIVYDVTNMQSYQNMEKWQSRFRDATKSDDIPIVIIGNKADLDVRVNSEMVKTEWISEEKA